MASGSLRPGFCPMARAWPVSLGAILFTNTLNPVSLQKRYSKVFVRTAAGDSNRTLKGCSANASVTKSATTLSFWGSPYVWKRAGINTLRCLAGCSLGDFSAMWFLQVNYPEMGMSMIMATSIAAGLATSMSLETVLLRLGRDRLTWEAAAKTATGMSLASMLVMELVQNTVDYQLTGGVVALDDAQFWTAAAISMLAGFLAPLPYNYIRLRKHGKGCH